jgi:protease IV
MTSNSSHSSSGSESPGPPVVHVPAGGAAEQRIGQMIVRVEAAPAAGRSFFSRIAVSVLISSILLNFWLIMVIGASQNVTSIPEYHLHGKEGAETRIAVINITGTISPPLTEKWLKQIRHAAEDKTVRGAVIAVDSPGGLVADSHQLYREIQKLVKVKPAYVAMKRLAASGGYYLAMGIGEQGKIFAEPTTWTGSIGVIIPRYNAGELAKNMGVRVEPLVTGPLKDSLNPFRDLSPEEQEVWKVILDDAFSRFVGVIAEGRASLDEEAVRKLATGQIYTAQQAVDNKLVDQLGYVEDAVDALAKELKLTEYDAIEYRINSGLLEAFLGAKISDTTSITEQVMDAAVPKAMYYCSWNPWVPGR